MERVFDRLVSFDERSKAFPVRTLFVENRVPRTFSYRYVQLDQGNEGACVGFSATMEAAAIPDPWFGDPRTASRTAIEQAARATYYRARQLDEWPGENYDGTSVLAGAKAGREQGWWNGYRWALGPGPRAAAQDVILALSYLGPVMMGAYWYEGMDHADARGFLHVSGDVLGGHAFLLTRYSKLRDAVWTPNSWGGYGQGWLSRGDLVTLLRHDGEACIPITRMMPQPRPTA